MKIQPHLHLCFLMERPFVPYTMLLAISAISSGHFCSLFKVIVIILSFSLFPPLKEEYSKVYETTFKRAFATSSGRAFEVPEKKAV